VCGALSVASAMHLGPLVGTIAVIGVISVAGPTRKTASHAARQEGICRVLDRAPVTCF